MNDRDDAGEPPGLATHRLPALHDAIGSRLGLTFMGRELAAMEAVQTDLEFQAPPLDGHFLALPLGASYRGFGYADGLISDYAFTAHAGSVSFLPAGRASHVRIEGEARLMQLVISRSMMDATKRELLAGDGERVNLFGFNALTNAVLEAQLRAALGALRRPGTGCALAFDRIAQEICTELVTNYADGRLRDPGPVPRLSNVEVMRAIDLLEACVPLQVGIAEIAAAMDLPQIYFAAAFEDATEQTPAAFLRERRVDRACEILDDAPEGVDAAELARRCGFASAEAIDGAFWARYGMGVASYRKVRA